MKTQYSADIQRLQKEMEYRNYSPRSILTYCSIMSRLEASMSKSLNLISVSELKKYMHDLLIQRNVSTSVINQHISAFKIFVQDVQQKTWHACKIKRPRRTKKMPEILSTNEIERMISLTSNLKHRTMLTIMYSAGLRRSELIHLQPSDIDSDRMLIRVKQGKGRKDRYTILSTKALDLLRLYYKANRPEKYLFEPNGRPGIKISETTTNEIVKQSAKRAKIIKKISCHTLRHSFATHLLEKGVNIKLIQDFLGHTSLRTTTAYLHLTDFTPSNIVSPLDNMRI